MKTRIAFFTVMPSPYQRDLFHALQDSKELDVQVYYQQSEAADSPWEPTTRLPYENDLPGWGFAAGGVRVQFNWNLPDSALADLWIVNATLTSPSAQWMMRHRLRGRRWLFWGERIRPGAGWKGRARTLLSSCLGKAQGIVAVGSAAARDYESRFPGRRVWNIPYHCDLEALAAERPNRTVGVTTFFFCGQMIHRKGIDLLLAAFARLKAGGLAVQLLLAGREAILPQLLSGLPAATRAGIEYVGFKQPQELPPLFARADVFVLPSRYDGWGVVVNQALGAGLPIIASEAAGAARDLIRPGENGLVVETGKVDALAEAMRRLAQNPSLATAWGDESRRLSRAWTTRAGVEKWEAVIREIGPARSGDVPIP